MAWQRRSLVSLLATYIPDTVQRRYVVERLLDGQVDLKIAGAHEYMDLLKHRLPQNVHPKLLKFLDQAMAEYVKSTRQKQDLAG